MVLGKLDSNLEKNETRTLFLYQTHMHKKNTKWIRDLNVKPETIKILQENTGSNLFDIGCSNFLLGMSPEVRETKAKINYWDFTKNRTKQNKNKETKKKN